MAAMGDRGFSAKSGKRPLRGLLLAGGVAILAALPAAVVFAQWGMTDRAVVRIDATGGEVKTGGASVTIRGNAESISAGGAQVTIRANVTNDVQVGGAQVAIDGTVGGDLKVGAALIDVSGQVNGSASLAAAIIRLNARVAREVNLAAATIDIGPTADIAGDLSVAGAVVTVDGHVAGSSSLAGAVISFNGRSDGTVTAEGSDIVVGPQAVITGDLVVRSGNEPTIEQGATISGRVRREESRWWRFPPPVMFGIIGAGIVIGTVLAGIVLLIFVRRTFDDALVNATSRPISSVLIGIATLIALPIVAAILLATVVGISFGVALLLLLPILLVSGHSIAAATVGSWLIDRTAAPRSPGRSILLLIVGAIILAIVWWIPFAGPPLVGIALLIGLGAIVRTAGARLRRVTPVPA
jgi:cytoskeletal protein CcmA (bactofilin family)